MLSSSWNHFLSSKQSQELVVMVVSDTSARGTVSPEIKCWKKGEYEDISEAVREVSTIALSKAEPIKLIIDSEQFT